MAATRAADVVSQSAGTLNVSIVNEEVANK